MSEIKKNKPNRVQARVSLEDFQLILIKARLYTKGDVSKFVRMAVMNYKPIKKVGVK